MRCEGKSEMFPRPPSPLSDPQAAFILPHPRDSRKRRRRSLHSDIFGRDIYLRERPNRSPEWRAEFYEPCFTMTSEILRSRTDRDFQPSGCRVSQWSAEGRALTKAWIQSQGFLVSRPEVASTNAESAMHHGSSSVRNGDKDRSRR